MKIKIINRLKNILWVLPILLISGQLYAQGERQVIMFSGIVVEGDSSFGVPGVHVYVPKAGRGTATDAFGYFSMPTLAGDTVWISAIGYRKQKLVIPNRKDAGFSVIIDLKADTTMLPLIEIFPYPSVEVFKEAFLAVKLPDEQNYENMRKSLDKEVLTRMTYDMPMDASMNYRNQMNNNFYRTSTRYFAPTFSFLNPFAWASFIQSVKRGDLKKKDWGKSWEGEGREDEK